MRILKRILKVIEGLVFIVLSLCWQSLFCIMLTMALVVPLKLEKAWAYTIFILLLFIFNAVACWEYFRKHRAQVKLGERASIIFMFPRALDLIWNDSERISR
jgi:hypothetical protein